MRGIEAVVAESAPVEQELQVGHGAPPACYHAVFRYVGMLRSAALHENELVYPIIHFVLKARGYRRDAKALKRVDNA